MDLAEWLLEQIAEDEAAALAAGRDYPAPWRGRELDAAGESLESGIVFDADSTEVVYWEAGSREAADRLGEHIARWDPARVLAECAAKRAIVDEHRPDELLSGPNDPRCRRCFEYPSGHNFAHPCRTLRLLAQPYADRPGYLPEHRP
jgi:Family of unknown function (DUF6221)